VPARPADKWSIVAAHGLVTDNEGPQFRSSPITPSDLAAVDWDYVALGHLHEHEIVREPPRAACYPGSTARSRRGEAGVVRLDLVPDRGLALEWLPLFSNSVQ
jgi:DNA repair exonuclease SbcCD nuclease subunit